MYLYPQNIIWYVKGTQFRSPLHQHSVKFFADIYPFMGFFSSDCERDSHFSADKDAYGADHMSEITVAGRIMLNLWRIIKHEVMYQPHYSFLKKRAKRKY